MNDILIYLLKVSAAIALVTLPYYLVLRNDASLVIKRIYLSGGLLLSWIFPLLTVRKPGLVSTMDPVFIIDPGMAVTPGPAASAAASGSITISSVITALYIAGIVVFCMLNVIALRRLRKNVSGPSGLRHILHTKSEKVFTVFPNIYLPEKYAGTSESNSILIHERAHIRQLHVVDLLISEITVALTWFNPFSWLISRMIKENHEHLADREVLSRGIKPAHYKAMLLNHAMGGEVFRFGHQFNHSLTKKRFNMMKKMKARKSGILKYILFIPAILAFTLMATATGQDAKTIEGKVYLESTDEPAVGASVIVKGTSTGTVVDRQGEFSLNAPGNATLVISFVGYETVVKSANAVDRRPVIMIPSSYEIDPGEIEPGNPDIAYKDPVKVRIVDADGTADMKMQGGGMNVDPAKDIVYLVDGKQVPSVDNIDPEDIQRIDVIKTSDDPMYRKYKDKDGVIVITTKSGVKTKPDKEAAEKVKAKEEADETFYVVEDVPMFPGGKIALRNYIYEHLEYPPKAKKEQIAGKVLVEMKVKTDGTLTDIRVNQSSNDIFNNAAMDVFRDMPAWKPGSQRGKRVSCKVIVPVRFNPELE